MRKLAKVLALCAAVVPAAACAPTFHFGTSPYGNAMCSPVQQIAAPRTSIMASMQKVAAVQSRVTYGFSYDAVRMQGAAKQIATGECR